jgi:penicillin-binding protein 2
VGDENGTGRILDRLNLDISGKTGTAQNRRSPHGWFIGYFPYKDTKYTICIFLENAGSSYEALRVTYKFLKEITEKDLL